MAGRDAGPTYADPADVASWAGGLSESFLMCREIGHSWRPFSAHWIAEDDCFDRTLRCTRCKTKRVQMLSAHGAIVSSQYIYPDGYQSNGMGRIVGDGRDALRLESLQRLVEKKSTGNGRREK
jgi:hypothetical protein